MDNNYTWVKTHKGIVQYLSDKENSQQELIDLLKSVGITPFNDKSKEGEHDIELKEIDPFTFFCYIHKYGAKRALGFLKQIAELLGLEKPTTVNGIPSAQPQRVWLFPPEYMRVNNEVPRLWNLFKKELKGDVDNDTFADVLNIKNVGRAKLTEALFYIKPEKYLPINGPTKPYIKEELGIDVEFTTYSEYFELLEKIRGKTDMPFYELSHEAWKWNSERKETATQVDEPAPEYNAIRSMIEDYKKHIAETHLKDEEYKWELVEKYKGRPNLEVKDLLEELKGIKYDNLMYAMGKAVLYRLAKDKTEEFRELLTQLFDETRDLTERVKLFNKQSLKLYRDLESKLGHHQDERSISTYLTFRYPEIYTFYKYSYYNFYCELLGVDKAKKNERYTHYLSLIDELIEQYIVPDVELIEQVKSYLPEYYDGKNHKLLAQDILFQMERRNAKEDYWVFQGNPDKYDFETAFKEDDIHAWTVSSHKASIKEGDKVIIWITGNKAGCYALADVVSDPMDRESFADSDLWKEEDTSELKAAINITHNLANNPILKDEVDKIKDLANLKVGSQGTNFSATEKEYNALLELAMKREEDKRYWLYSPGEQAKNWEEFYNDGIMGLGWDKLDDLKKYKSKDEIKEALDEAYGGDGSKKNDTTANDEFANVTQVGDVVIVKKGLYELLGYGVVTSDYIYDATREEYKHVRKVKWELKGNWNVGFQMVTKTLTDITPYETEDPNYNWYYERLIGIMKGENGTDIDIKTTHPLNTIFYGPPGTGKTYNTVLRAAEIVEGRKIETYDEALQIFKEKLHNEIEFITFHQNYSYEDFIQGLRPDIGNEKELTFEKKDGVFKVIADRALKNHLNADDKKEVKKNYVIIIDEINRANISRVFGELITLIEPDKRSHGEIPLATKLPSGDTFMVPSNLYIIGTMNTADKSIALLDIALRRRFVFEAMYPKYTVDGLTIHDEAILRSLNESIIADKGHDFQIGHSFFMTSREDAYDLEKRMNRRVIPLLLEYFMNDGKAVSQIVNKALVNTKYELDDKLWPLEIGERRE